MAAKTTRASVEKVRKGIQERTGVTPTARHSEIPSLKSTANTEQVLRDLGQTDVARGSNTFSVEAAKSGSPITSGFVNAFADNPKLASAASFLAGSSVANDIFRQRQNEAMKGTLTNEMKSAGLTQADIDTWNAEQNEKERQQVMSQWAKDHPIMTTLNAIPENAFGSIEGNINKAIDYVKGNPIQSKQTNADIYRQSVAENIDSKLGRGAYGVANSIGDMLFAAWLTGGLGGGGATQGAKGLAKLLRGLPAAGVMGLEKSNQVMNDASERGLTNNQIAAEGLLSGASTALTEALPFSKFGEGGHIVGSMLAEGLQEGSEDILDTFFDELVTRVGGNGNKSDLSTRYRQYLSAGYNADEARKAVTTDYIKQVIMDTLAGGAAGGAMGGLGNFMGGRNVITGKIPSLNTEENVQTEAKTEEDIEAEDYLRSILEEANQMELHPENVNRNEQTQQAPEVPEVAQQVQPKVAQPIEQQIQQVQQTTQPEAVEQPTIPSLTNRQLAQYTRQVEGLIDKLGMFGNKSFNKSLNNALTAVQNTQGEEQQNAIASLNNLVSQIDEQMAGSEVGVNQRTINQDMYDDMKRVTDGYVVKVNDNMLDEMGLTLKQLNDRVNTTARDGVNHIRFVKGNTGTPIDSVYNELYELSNHQLPDPRSMAEGDQLKAVYDYVTRAKAGKNEMAQTATWENVPVLENRTKAETDMESQTDAILDKIANGTVTDEDYANFRNFYSDTYFQNYDKPSINAINDMMEEVKQAYSNYMENAGLDEEIASATTANEVQSMIDSTIDNMDGAFRMNLQFHGGQTNNNVNTDEDSRKLHTGNFKTSEYATNSFPRSKAMTKTEIKSVLSDADKQYEAVTHEGTLNKATKNIEQNGFTNELKDLMERKEWDAVDVDESMIFAFKAAKEARNMIEKGVDPKEAWKQSVEIFKKSREHATTSGQALEALKKWSSRTPEGKLAKAIAFAREAAGPGDERLKGAVKSVGKSQGFTFSDEFMADFLDKAHQYDGQDISFAKQARLDQELAHMVWDQIPKKFKAKFTSLWMDNLLASFRTLISRNVGGNAGKFLLDQTATKAISGPIDSLVSRLTGGRTTTGFTREGAKIALKGLKQGAFETTRDYWGGQLDPDKVNSFKDLVNEFKDFDKLKKNFTADANVSNRPGNEGDFEETLKNNRSVFESKVFKTYDKLIKYGLAVSDNTFYRSVYNQTLYELNELRKSGKLEEALQNVSDEKFETWAKAYATAQGLEAVYQNDSMLSDGAMKIKNGIGQMSKGLLGVDVVSDASFPFVRTPMNVINTNLEFSPLGIVKNLLTTIKEIRTNLNEDQNAFATKTSGGAFDQGRFVRETSRNIVGSMLFVAALMMKNAGMLTGGYSDDPREKQAQKDAGMQEYAFVNPLNGNQYSVDWIPALGSNLVSAAAFSDAYGKPDQSGLNAIANGAKAGAKSLFEQSALQGLQRLVGQQNYNSEGSVIDNAIQTVANTASSAIVPSFVRQSAAALDPYKRNTYGMGGNESIINNAIAGIPFLRQALLQPRIGSNGQPMVQNAGRNTLQKWLDNLVNPAMVTVPSALADPVRDEANRLYESTKDTKAYQPKIGLSYLAVDGHTPTTEEYTEFLQIADSAMSQIASDVIQSDYYSTLSDEEKVNVLNGIYSAVQSVERAKYLGIDKDYTGADKAYFEGGAEGLMDYYRAKDTLSNMGAQNNPDNRELVTEAMNNGTFDDMEQLGFDVNLIKRFNHAAERIPSLNPTTFQQQFNAIDTSVDGTGNNSITQKEIIAYLNQNPTGYNEEEALRIWDAYLQSYGKIPVFNPEKGTWSAK